MGASTAPKRTRVNMRVPTDLLDWAKKYAESGGTCVTKLFIDHLTDLMEKERGYSSNPKSR